MKLFLSIIVPVFNVEKYIRPCIESILKQGIDEKLFEIIIVNDGTKDKSLEMISDIIANHSNITIINQDNQGVSVARNKGIALARGEYVIIPDSDDLLFELSLNPLLDIALNTGADLVVADFIQMSDEEILKTDNFSSKQKPLPIKIQETTGHELYTNYLDFNNCAMWHILFKRDFLVKNDLSFLPNTYFEDLLFTPESYLKANKCIKVSWNLYIYRRRADSVSLGCFSKKKAESLCVLINKNWELQAIMNSQELVEKSIYYITQLIQILLYSLSHSEIRYKDRKHLLNSIKQIINAIYSLEFSNKLLKKFFIRTMPVFYTYIRHYIGKSW